MMKDLVSLSVLMMQKLLTELVVLLILGWLSALDPILLELFTM